MIKESIQYEDTTYVYIYAPNLWAPKYIVEIIKDIKVDINGNTIMTGDFNNPFTSMH